jgi:threonine synthase
MRWTSSRDPTLRVPFLEAVRTNVPPGGGLYVPDSIEPFPDLPALLALPFAARSIEIVARLVAPEIARADVERLVGQAFGFPLPLAEVADGSAACELWHGPSLSFKDFGVRFLAALLELEAERAGAAGVRTVLTATSGDTGAAVAAAFHGRPGFRVAVLFPRGRISPLQERQISTLGANVLALAVAGGFDDCQAMVRAAFADERLAGELGLVAANSVHVARLVAQTLYYFEIAATAPGAAAGELVVAVPSGNFGNLYSGLLARELGAPVAAFVAATNANATVPEHLETGVYRPRASVETLSNAMDVGAPSNWERALALFGGDLDAVRAVVRAESVSDDETRAEAARLAALEYEVDPHGAVASAALRRAVRTGERGVFLATAHPAKFESTRDPGRPLPTALAAALTRPSFTEPFSGDLQALARRLRRQRSETTEGVPR